MMISFPCCLNIPAASALNTQGMVQVLNIDNLVTYILLKGTVTEPHHMAVYSKIFMLTACNKSLSVIVQQERNRLQAFNREVRC